MHNDSIFTYNALFMCSCKGLIGVQGLSVTFKQKYSIVLCIWMLFALDYEE